MDLTRNVGLISVILGIDLGHFGLISGFVGLDLGNLGLISEILSLDLGHFRDSGSGFELWV